jgi:GNAT superfamily N-acetyltransferase
VLGQPASESIRIVAAGREHLSTAGQVLAQAFQGEASTNFILNLATPRARRSFAHAMTLSLIHYYAKGYTILLAMQGEAVVGVAVLARSGAPARISFWARLRDMAPFMCGLLQLAGHLRWRSFLTAGRAIQTPSDLKEGNDLLEWLAVAPEQQGRGIGRMLLAALSARQRDESRERGIYTYTVGEANLAFYQRCGYHLRARHEANPTFVVYHIVLPPDVAGA